MTLLTRFDTWAGLKLFHPPIIRFCQATGYTQGRVNREMWFALGLYLMWSAYHADRPWWLILLFGLFAVALGLRAALLPDVSTESSGNWFRKLLWFFLLTDVIFAVLMPTTARSLDVIETVWTLFAEYAATISSIPPRKPRAPVGRGSESAA